ncbi:helix-turn-helix domain-containing protein [Paracoccus denitrificans]|uniref:helix-turn-helix domain-containing protein n=1 Tax=Paracoccus denitrificans TaxID=266 RepID=UPI001E37CE66|nr:helix-turn-helix transcriptional regulator [Paracoccus denitrificans]UFS66261.1 helix-turn-helix domain-containing protein [Paracoccus denitrificans]
MKQSDIQIFDFGDDESDEDESYLLQDHAEGLAPRSPASRPLHRILKDVRQKLGLTQTQMAKLMKVSPRSYKSYELQDVRKVPATAMQLLAERTHISAAYLLTGYDVPVDYAAVADEVLALQHVIWRMSQRPDGNEYGMSTELSPGEALSLAIELLTKRDRLRREHGNADLQIMRSDILELIEEWTDHNRNAHCEWDAYYDPAYYGRAPFPCPAMYVVPQFLDMADFRKYSRLRSEIYKTLSDEDRTLYREWSRLERS